MVNGCMANRPLCLQEGEMLLIIFGTTGKLGENCRKYLNDKGFETVNKYSYAENKPHLQSRYSKREFLSKEDFLQKTDSLFRYTVDDIQVGFNWNQISDAVYGNKNKLLTFSAFGNIQFLMNIKEVYKDKVRIVYCYIETNALDRLFVQMSENGSAMTNKEYGVRMGLGHSVKKLYLEHADLFDSVVVYAGEDSLFDYNSLYQQFDAILKTPSEPEKTSGPSDLFITYSIGDLASRQETGQLAFIQELIRDLEKDGYRVLHLNTIDPGDTKRSLLSERVLHSRIFMPIVNERSLSRPNADVMETALNIARNSGLIILPVLLDHAVSDHYPDPNAGFHILSEDYSEGLAEIRQWIRFMFSTEDELRRLSDETEACIETSLYQKAFELQESYLVLLNEYLSRQYRKGSAEKLNALIKYLDLSILLDNHSVSNSVLNEILSVYAEETADVYRDKAVHAFVSYCLKWGFNETDIRGRLSQDPQISDSGMD